MQLVFIVNASASSVTARARVVIQKALAADHQVSVAETSRRGHATRLAQGAAANGADVVVVLGGDGTLNEAANGLAGTPTALGVLPGGSTNVFARTLGMTNDPIEATGELLGALSRCAIRSIGLGTVNGRVFLFHVGFGYDAAVVAQVERRAALKRYAGPALFLTAAVSTWFRHYDRRHPSFGLRGEPRSPTGEIHELDDGYFGVCMNTNPYTFLGTRPLDLAPGTSLDDGLTMATLRRLDLATLLPLLVGVLRGRGLAGRRHAAVATDLARITLVGHHPLPYQVDGDYLGEATHFDLRYWEGALRLVVP